MLRSAISMLLLAIISTPPLAAQGLRDRISELFTFGTCGEPLCLDVPNEHGDHFNPAVAEGNQTVIAFLTEAIGRSTAKTPISATSSGATFAIVGGLPVKTSTSAGPVFGERSHTLGRGRFFLAASVNALAFTSLNGAPLDNLELNFTHEDVGTGGLGDPVFENDVLRLRLDLDVNVLVAALVGTWGVADFVDLGVAVPFVRTSISGTTTAQIDAFGAGTPHFFGGDITTPILQANSALDASAAGVGDIVTRLKVNLGQSQKVGAALLAEVRLPTGDEDDLLGSGAAAVQTVGIVAAQFGTFSPHFNFGYIARTGELQNDAALVTVGFDNLMAPWATLAFDLISEWRLGAAKLSLPAPVVIEQPVRRQVAATSIPNRREDRLDASFGAKFSVRGGTVLVINGIVPLIEAGLQPDFLWTAGLEFSF